MDKEITLDGLEQIIASTYAAEQEFKQMKLIMDQVIEFLPTALWVLDGENNFFVLNSEAKSLSCLFDKLDRTKKTQEVDHNDKIYLIKINPNENNTIITAIDITEQKRSERLAAMGQVSAHLAHEIRNPIGSISILASTLLGQVETKNKLLVMEIKKSIYRVERIIKSTLLFTKGVTANKKRFSLLELEDEMESSFEFYSLSKDIELDIDFSHDKELFGDFDLLSIVFQNFLYNGLDAIEEDDEKEGIVTISHDSNNEFDIITIKDSGVPIENKNILFEPFKTTKLQGHGLGLALSLEIIKAHGGKVELLKETKGFSIYLRKEV